MKFTVGQPLTPDQLAYITDLERKVADRRRRIAELERQVGDLDADPGHGSHATLVRRERRAREVAGRLRGENTRLRALLRGAHATQETTPA